MPDTITQLRTIYNAINSHPSVQVVDWGLKNVLKNSLEEECFKQTVSLGFKPGIFDPEKMEKTMLGVSEGIRLASRIGFKIHRPFKAYKDQLRLGAVKFKLDEVSKSDLIDLLAEKFTNFDPKWNYWASVRLNFFPSAKVAEDYLDGKIHSYDERYHAVSRRELERYAPDFKPGRWNWFWNLFRF